MSEEYKEISIKNVETGKPEKFKLKYALWIDDMADQSRLVDPTGKPNVSALWICRIAKALGTSEDEVRKFKSWKTSALVVAWLAMNDVNQGSFLGDTSQDLKNTLESSTSLKENSISQNPN